MSTTPEGRVKAQVKAWLKKHGIWYFMPAANGLGIVGIPDIICCVPPAGKFLAVECKAPGKRDNTTANQKQRIEEIQRARGWALVVDDVSQLQEFFELLGEGHAQLT